jgi:phosphate starvation-inducible PhoH-like protein
MKEPNRIRKNEIKVINQIQLNDEQKEAKRLIIDNQIVIITGAAGSGKSLVCSNAALDFLLKKQCDKILVTRATIEVGKSLGFLPGMLDEKFNPYIEGFVENLNKTYDKNKVEELVKNNRIIGMPVQFIRGKTIDDILIVEEAQNLTQHEMLAILTRLGKTGKIIINGDNDQMDIKTPNGEINGLSFAIELSKKIDDIKKINLKHNHRSDLVGKILEYFYSKKSIN